MKSLKGTALVATVAACVVGVASAGMNPDITLPLHALPSTFEPCDGYLPVDCEAYGPTVTIEPGPTAIFLLAANYNALAGVQTAFLPDPTWTFTYGLWDCRPGQLVTQTPAPPFGPTAGTVAIAFSCLGGPGLAAIGRMYFTAGSTGCLEQVESSYPFGIHVIDCQQGIDQIPAYLSWRLGKVCVGDGGIDACEGPQPAVDAATWGRIKAQYQ